MNVLSAICNLFAWEHSFSRSNAWAAFQVNVVATDISPGARRVASALCVSMPGAS